MRYIDADKVMEEIASMGGHNLCEWSTLGVKALIDRQPTADVAPKSEVEYWKQQCFRACMNNGCLDVVKIKENLSYGHPDPAGEPGDEGEPGMLYCTYWRMRHAEVAREIFEEIENEINNDLKNNKRVLPQIEISNALWNRVSGKINALQGVLDYIAELKKKYTEPEPPKGD